MGVTVWRMQVVLEEFGKWIKSGTSANLAERDEFYTAIYQEVSHVCPTVLPHASFPRCNGMHPWQTPSLALCYAHEGSGYCAQVSDQLCKVNFSHYLLWSAQAQ